jgi:hypothetical protein
MLAITASSIRLCIDGGVDGRTLGGPAENVLPIWRGLEAEVVRRNGLREQKV